MTPYDFLGLPRTYKDLLRITISSYDFIMILQWLYNETMTSYDLLGPSGTPRTSQDLLGITMISYDFIMILQWSY